MSTQVTGTEHVAAALKLVTVGSQRLRVPVSPPLGFMFKHGAFVRKLAAETLTDDDVESYYGEIVDFLGHYNPAKKFSEEKLLAECSLSDLISFYNSWWGPGSGDTADDDESEAGEERPPQRRGTSGANRSRSRSRS